ncbi:MAG: hypothetical protein ACK559_40000 [bacterium]
MDDVSAAVIAIDPAAASMVVISNLPAVSRPRQARRGQRPAAALSCGGREPRPQPGSGRAPGRRAG